MQIHVLSDLHMDEASWSAPGTSSDVIVLAGDLFDDARRSMQWCKELRAQTGKPLILVPGNHDFYGRECYQDALAHMKDEADQGEVCLLHNESTVIGGVRFVGATLWTDYCGDGPGLRSVAMHAAGEFMQDFQQITYRDGKQVRPMTPSDAINLHTESLLAIQAGIEDAYSERVVVITHHAPLVASLDPKYRGSALNPSMASDLDDLVRYSMARLWIHGHVHHSLDYQWGSTRVLCNPRGQQKPGNSDFDPHMVVSV